MFACVNHFPNNEIRISESDVFARNRGNNISKSSTDKEECFHSAATDWNLSRSIRIVSGAFWNLSGSGRALFTLTDSTKCLFSLWKGGERFAFWIMPESSLDYNMRRLDSGCTTTRDVQIQIVSYGLCCNNTREIEYDGHANKQSSDESQTVFISDYRKDGRVSYSQNNTMNWERIGSLTWVLIPSKNSPTDAMRFDAACNNFLIEFILASLHGNRIDKLSLINCSVRFLH